MSKGKQVKFRAESIRRKAYAQAKQNEAFEKQTERMIEKIKGTK